MNLIVALMVTCNPDPSRLHEVLASVMPQVSRILVVDNGSRKALKMNLVDELLKVEGCWDLLEDNMGLGYALNLVVREGLMCFPRADWFLMLDQDTIIADDAVQDTLMMLNKLPDKGDVWVVAMGRSGKEHYSCELESARMVIHSGNLVRASVCKLFSYREEFFVDQIDREFCREILDRGGRIMYYDKPMMQHQIGKVVVVNGKEIEYQPPLRVYYILRNSTRLLIEGNLSLKHYLYQAKYWVRHLSIVRGKRAAVKPLMTGLFDGLINRMGKCSWKLEAG